MPKRCRNCGYEVTGNYCSECSQKTQTDRFTFKHIINELSYGFTNLDSGILYTIKCLFTRWRYV